MATPTTVKINEHVPLEAVLDSFLEGADFPGAYYCDLTVFKSVCQIEARAMCRSGRTTFVARFETKIDTDTKSGGVIKQLGAAIPRCLRMGDMFTRSTPCQYMLMLHNLTYEDCKALVDRIMYTVDAKYLSKITGVSIKPLKPVMRRFGVF